MKADVPTPIIHAAETHWYIRPMLKSRLCDQWVDPNVVQKAGRTSDLPWKTDCWTWWVDRKGIQFFDMGTLIRVAAGVETGLRDYLCKKRASNLDQLRIHLAKDPRWKGSVFQRIQPWQTGNSANDLIKSELNYDLSSNPHLREVRELVLHRHLYAHNAGVLDEQYIESWKKLTDEDLTVDPEVQGNYPAKDVYWFRPLNRLTDYINAAKGFFLELP
jgi:hypothetical protein